MSRVVHSALRVNQKAVGSIENGLFNGNLSVVLLPVDYGNKLTFQANVTVFTGDLVTPSREFTPCDDNGNVKTFGDVDDVIRWLKGAYLDIVSVSITIADFDLITKKLVPPTDPVANAVKQKAYYQRLRTGLADNIASALAKVNAAIASGWSAENAHPALKANYDELVFKKMAVDATDAHYVAKIAQFDAIITP